MFDVLTRDNQTAVYNNNNNNKRQFVSWKDCLFLLHEIAL